ncbi:hypothetical protein [Jannaschia rubra]|uniref:Uncharacterized protein n=1 Tax=Jannaschia rubra TaxID=282197 RepID=A0A0M6XQC8_9RHOB|nr:hypothetical protein [Jannaschia rubra]CTQ33350.1 hypothetical protein JAN5088_02132 [Jannaschia rubra]SFF99789.1 hypothetical protein SAMN04488517_102180 [Jannaschia rubra]
MKVVLLVAAGLFAAASLGGLALAAARRGDGSIGLRDMLARNADAPVPSNRTGGIGRDPVPDVGSHADVMPNGGNPGQVMAEDAGPGIPPVQAGTDTFPFTVPAADGGTLDVQRPSSRTAPGRLADAVPAASAPMSRRDPIARPSRTVTNFARADVAPARLSVSEPSVWMTGVYR